MKVYFDNAATTPLAPEVLEHMMPYLQHHFGNPSSTHHFGRTVKSGIEMARKTIAQLLHCSPMEICFTSGGTEADNMAIRGAVSQLGVRHIISSPAEHHAVLHTVEDLAEQGHVRLSMVQLDDAGRVNLEHLESLLAEATEKTLVSLMHANNEIGTLLPLQAVSALCATYGALLHTDTVQTMGHLPINLQETKVHFLVGAAHKFHGPKGVGFLYINRQVHIDALIRGGAQERNLRAGTENIYGIVGMARALELACTHMHQHRNRIDALRTYMKHELVKHLPGVSFNGCQNDYLYTVLNVRLPETDKAAMLLFLLDIDGIAASGGSACSSGSNQGSHVLRAIGADHGGPSVRFSFSRYSTKEEADYVVARLKHHFQPVSVAAVR
jgi:cysteine desulfurase